MCMSCTGGNSALPIAQTPLMSEFPPTGLPFPSTQIGATRRLTMSGTAFPRSACLSPIDAELSIMKRRSILSTLALCTTAVKFVCVIGLALVSGRERHPAPRIPSTPKTVARVDPSLIERIMIALSFETRDRDGDLAR